MNARRAASDSTEFPWEWRLSDLKAPEEGAPKVFSTFACGGGPRFSRRLLRRLPLLHDGERRLIMARGKMPRRPRRPEDDGGEQAVFQDG